MCRMHDPVLPVDCPKRENWHSLSGEARPIARFADWSQADAEEHESAIMPSTLGKSFATLSLLPETPRNNHPE
jgi:hypothetical protein